MADEEWEDFEEFQRKQLEMVQEKQRQILKQQELEKKRQQEELEEQQFQSKKFVPGQVSIKVNSDRTQYTPQIQLLKRQPNQNQSNSQQQNFANNNSPTSQLKPIGEREKDYLEARKRIFGEESS